MTTKSMWKGLETNNEPELTRTPFTVLKDQALALTEATENRLRGRATRSVDEDGDSFNAELYVSMRLQSFRDYRLTILTVEYPRQFFPLRMYDAINDRTFDCKNQDEFEMRLQEILGSPDTTKAIKELLGHTL
ncbi:MAG: hypothetical protein IIB17_10710 [Chloroflexi bacterium]|nr:hypothetical protein [Chloroflexota bacterium]